MKLCLNLVLAASLFVSLTGVALADNVRTDYDHSANFASYHSYSWGKVQTSDPFYVSRIKQAVDKELQAKGWQLMPTGGAVTIFATDNVHNQKEVQTMYNGMGGGWGGGWGWGGWGWSGIPNPGGFGDGSATTTTTNQPVSNLVIDLFDSSNKKLLWRGLATQNLSSNAARNTKGLDGDIARMFKTFPPKPGSN